MDPIDFNWFTLYPCAMSFFQSLCSASFPPVSCSFPEPHPDPQGCLYNVLKRQTENSWPWREILYNIQPPNPTQYWSHWRSWGRPNSSLGGPRRSSRLNLPGDSISRRLSHLSLPGDLHPDPGTPGSQVATVLGKMNLYRIYYLPWWAN